MSAPHTQLQSLLPPPDEADFRARLLAGMAQSIREHGSFHETTVAEVVRNARTSRRTFYAHFADRETCFIALVDELASRHLAAVADAATGDGLSWTERIDRALDAYLGALAAEPILSRCCIQDIWSIGPVGIARAQELNEEWARRIAGLVDEAREQDPTLSPMSLEAATVITGGFRDLVLVAMGRGEDVTALHAVGTDLIRRITSG